MIFYFSGTGNSLYVAQQIADILGEQIYSMAAYKPDAQIGGKDERIGFVFPSYYGNLPRIVRHVIGKLDIHPDSYLFGVVTKGGAGSGSITMLERALAEKNLQLQYGTSIPMPANYIVNYNPMLFGRTAKAGKIIQKIASEIQSAKTLVKKGRFISSHLYENIEELDKAFFAEDQCVGCGLCESICPVGNIRMADGRPQWLHQCEHCMACIHRCPQEAIQYGAKTKKRRRYYNPEVRSE